jgi:hypothetical protein
LDANGRREPAEGDWIIVPKWDRFQHYGDRRPTWIKVYARLLQDPNYLSLSMAEKGLLTIIWLSYSQQNCELSLADLVQICGKRVSKVALVSLNHAGFIHFSASKPLAPNKEVEKEKEKTLGATPENPRARKATETRRKELLRRARDVALDWHGGLSADFESQLDDLERELRLQLPQSQRRHLWDDIASRNEPTHVNPKEALETLKRHLDEQ